MSAQNGKEEKKCCQRQVENYKDTESLALGVTHIVLAMTIIAAQICATIGKTAFSSSAMGYWITVTFISTGVQGILAGKNKRASNIKVFMTMSCISAVQAGILSIVYGLSIYYNPKTYCKVDMCVDNMYRDAIDACLCIFGFSEMVVAIVSAVIAGQGMGMCGGNKCATSPA